MTINKNKLLLGSTAVMVALSPLAAQQLRAASLSLSAVAHINSMVGLYSIEGINFATVSQTPLGGTLRMGFTDNITTLAGGLNPVGGTPTSGGILLKIAPGMQTKISATTATYKVTTLGGGMPSKSMTLSNITYRVGTKIGPNLTFTPAVWTNDLDIGADLKIDGPHVQGMYTGNIKVMVTQP